MNFGYKYKGASKERLLLNIKIFITMGVTIMPMRDASSCYSQGSG